MSAGVPTLNKNVVDLGESTIVSSTVAGINIIAPPSPGQRSPLARSGVQPVAGYTGYIPRHIAEDIPGRSRWHSLREVQSAAPPGSPSSVSSAASVRPGQYSPPVRRSLERPAIGAVPGYSGFVPSHLRGPDGRFRTAIIAPAAEATTRSRAPQPEDSSVEYSRDRHVTGYTGYVPRSMADNPGVSRFAAVTDSVRTPSPDRDRLSRTIFSLTASV